MVYTEKVKHAVGMGNTMVVVSNIGKRMRELREELGLTQEQVATAIGVTRAAISMLERGTTHTMEWPHLKAAAKFFRVEVEYLAEGKGPRRVRNPSSRSSEETVQAADDLEEMTDEQKKLVLSMIRQISRR